MQSFNKIARKTFSRKFRFHAVAKYINQTFSYTNLAYTAKQLQYAELIQHRDETLNFSCVLHILSVHPIQTP